jgi:hypothetical protein
MTKTNEIVILLTWHHFGRKPIGPDPKRNKLTGELMVWRINVQARVKGCPLLCVFAFLSLFFFFFFTLVAQNFDQFLS